MAKKKTTPVQSYIKDLDMFVSGSNFWQASLLRQLEGLNHKQALWKPAPDRHCIWQVVRHINYWKYWTITFAKDGLALDARAENWSPLPKVLNEKNWRADVNKLKTLNRQCKVIAKKLGVRLFTSTEKKIVFFRQHLYHDCYHTGQIGLLRVMQGLKPLPTN